MSILEWKDISCFTEWRIHDDVPYDPHNQVVDSKQHDRVDHVDCMIDKVIRSSFSFGYLCDSIFSVHII